ncbi:MAG TPA: DUF4310 family protein [Firmicutes bacterium]|nr:DUF4310 family protein [Candidatus Fermentithermobacillaceae bacterium]
MENKQDTHKGIWWHPLTFPVLLAMACAAGFGGTSMQLVHGKGAFGSVVLVQMLNTALESGNFAVLSGYAGGFLFARFLEGPLVGILDIGGSICTGISFGVTGLMLAAGWKSVLTNFPLALLCGGAIGLGLGLVIEAVRKGGGFTTSASAATGMMMGAGNSIGAFFGPLVIVTAIRFSIPAGVGAIVGAALMYAMKKPIVGGAIIGAMILGTLGPIPA